MSADRPDSTDLRRWAFDIGDRPSSLRTYRAARLVSKTLLVPYLRVVAENVEVLNRSGPMILAPVHRSHLDSVLIATVCNRRLRALGKESLFTTLGVGRICAALGAIPVRRGSADKESLKAAKALLDRGESMFVFPEGERFEGDPNQQNTVQPLFDGAAWLASRTGAVVVPIGLAGTAQALGPGRKFIRRSRVGISVGYPLDPPVAEASGRPKRQQLTEFTARLREALQDRQNRAVELAATAPSGRSHKERE